MQALIPLFVCLSLVSGTHLTLLPYAYLADPLPVYHQSQNTRTGEHAFSYAGGPSAKEEVKGLDGVTRGSYSYVDAHGILQSVFYVADEDGFRVAATNLPSDDDHSVETSEILLAKNLYHQQEEQGSSSSRRKRSLQDSDGNVNQNRAGEKSDSSDNIEDQSQSESVQSAVYQLPSSVLLPKLLATATSHQSQVQIHRNVKLEPLQHDNLPKIEAQPLYQPVIIPETVPVATSHQSQVQIHNNVRLEVPQAHVKLVKTHEPVEVVHVPLATTVKGYQIESLPLVVPSYHDNRIQLHKDLGLEGSERKDAVKIKTEPVAVLRTPLAAAVPLVSSVVAKEAIPVAVQPASLATATVTASVSSHGVSQIHGNSEVKLAAPVLTEPTVLLRTAPVIHQPLVGLPLLHALPYARASHYRTQIHAN